MTDQETRITELRDVVRRFVDDRDWRQFHSPKNLSMSLAIEVAELMEHFQWISADASWKATENPERREAIREELADVFCYLLAMANELGIDLSTAIRRKMAGNEQKYPAEEYRGRFGPDDPGE